MKRRDFAKLCESDYCFGHDISHDASKCVTKSKKEVKIKQNKSEIKRNKSEINVNNKTTLPEQLCDRGCDT